MTQINDTYITFKDPYLVAVCKCDYCGYPNIAMKQRLRGGNMDLGELRFAYDNDEQAQYLYWLPDEPLGREFEEVPEHIADAASEAYACFSIRSYRAAILMARSVLEATAKDKGVEKGNLASKIDALADKGVISPQIKDEAHEIRYLGNDMAHGDFAKDKGVEKGNLASKIDALADKGVISPQIKDEAHEIRYLGNDMAHGDFVEPVTEEDADDMLGFLATFLNYVYQMPAAIRRRQDARRKRQGNPNE